MAWTQADVDAIDTAIKAKITGGAIQSYATEIGGRNVTHMSLPDLWALRDKAADEVARAAAAAAGSDFTLVRTRPV